MTLKQVFAKSVLAAGVGLAAIGLSTGVAGADVSTWPSPPPPPPVPARSALRRKRHLFHWSRSFRRSRKRHLCHWSRKRHLFRRPACAAGSGSPGRACGAAAATDPAHSTDPAGPADPTHPGLIGITLAPSLALRQRRGAPIAWKLVRSRFHSVRPTGSTPRAINSRLRILLVAVVGRSSASQT